MTTVQHAMAPARSPASAYPATWRARWALTLVLTCAVLTGPIGYMGQNAYAALVAACGVLSLPMLAAPRRLPRGIGLGIAILLALALWAVVSMAWSPYAALHADLRRYKDVEGLTALKLVLQAVLYGAFALFARETPRRWADRILLALTLGLGLILVVMIVDAFTGWAAYGALRQSVHAPNKDQFLQRNAGRGCFTIAVLFWPAAVWLKRRGWGLLTPLLAIGLVVASIGLHVDSPVVALALGGLVLVAVQRFGRPAIWALLGATLLYFALTPAFFALAGPHLPHFRSDHGVAKASWGVRLDLWRFSAARILERPWQGWGIDASRVWREMELHPHNAVLQLWLELGFVGAALGALFWLHVWSRIGAVAEQDPANAGVFAAVAMAYLSIGGMSFGVWQEWWLALGVIAVVVCDVLAKAGPSLNLRADRRNEPHAADAAPAGTFKGSR